MYNTGPQPASKLPTYSQPNMELELGLALPGNNSTAMFDLNLSIDEDGGNDIHNKSQMRVLVGWPPVKCAVRAAEAEANRRRRRGTCVKVKMEGLVIGRKVDLALHRSYHDLFWTLNEMFPCGDGDLRRHYQHCRVIMYEDCDGNWMLVGDVPWEDFIRSVKRLKIPC